MGEIMVNGEVVRVGDVCLVRARAANGARPAYLARLVENPGNGLVKVRVFLWGNLDCPMIINEGDILQRTRFSDEGKRGSWDAELRQVW